jgi:glycerol-3-phosphate dehydrogenase subunit B
MIRYDTVVIGAGTAGLMVACQLARAGQKVLVAAHGMGAMLLASGCVDVLGYHPAESQEPVKNPEKTFDVFVANQPGHPYKMVGADNLKSGLDAFLAITTEMGLEYQGKFSQNWLLPTGAGAVHPTCLAPASLVKGDLTSGKSMLIVGFRELRDFYPAYISQNINEQDLGIQAVHTIVDQYIPVSGKDNATPMELAHAFEKSDFRRQVIKAIKDQAKKVDRVGFPATLGVNHHREVVSDLEKQLGRPVFEISALPPSVPGRRLYEALTKALRNADGELIVGSKVVDGTIEAGSVTQIRIETTNRLKPIKAHNYVLATGGLFGGGLYAGEDGQVTEAIFNLPVVADANRHRWFEQKFISPNGQPVFNFGVKVDQHMRPVNGSPEPVADNLYVAGAAVAGSDWTRGRTGDGVSLGTAAAIAAAITA